MSIAISCRPTNPRTQPAFWQPDDISKPASNKQPLPTLSKREIQKRGGDAPLHVLARFQAQDSRSINMSKLSLCEFAPRRARLLSFTEVGIFKGRGNRNPPSLESVSLVPFLCRSKEMNRATPRRSTRESWDREIYYRLETRLHYRYILWGCGQRPS